MELIPLTADPGASFHCHCRSLSFIEGRTSNQVKFPWMLQDSGNFANLPDYRIPRGSCHWSTSSRRPSGGTRQELRNQVGLLSGSSLPSTSHCVTLRRFVTWAPIAPWGHWDMRDERWPWWSLTSNLRSLCSISSNKLVCPFPFGWQPLLPFCVLFPVNSVHPKYNPTLLLVLSYQCQQPGHSCNAKFLPARPSPHGV